MHKREASFQTKFNEYCRQNKLPTAAYELKQCETSLPFSAVKEHQRNALQAASQNIICYKIPDDTRSYKPFDSFCLTKTPAYVVVLYRKTNMFYAIPIADFLVAERFGYKSLNESYALKIAAFSGKI